MFLTIYFTRNLLFLREICIFPQTWAHRHDKSDKRRKPGNNHPVHCQTRHYAHYKYIRAHAHAKKFACAHPTLASFCLTLQHAGDIQADKEGQHPFGAPFYLLIDMQLGDSWVGRAHPDQLPVEMEIEWVKMYETADTKDAQKRTENYNARNNSATQFLKGQPHSKCVFQHFELSTTITFLSSVSVYDRNTSDRMLDNGCIAAEMLLANQIRGFVEDPLYHFQEKDSIHKRNQPSRDFHSTLGIPCDIRRANGHGATGKQATKLLQTHESIAGNVYNC